MDGWMDGFMDSWIWPPCIGGPSAHTTLSIIIVGTTSGLVVTCCSGGGASGSRGSYVTGKQMT
jgi:hypothetical protein